MRHTDYTKWSTTRGDLRVDEVEHMFGFDLILSQKVGPQIFGPLRTITGRTHTLTAVEQCRCKRWLKAYEEKEWAQIEIVEQQLMEA
jgi:hypothetical protein